MSGFLTSGSSHVVSPVTVLCQYHCSLSCGGAAAANRLSQARARGHAEPLSSTPRPDPQTAPFPFATCFPGLTHMCAPPLTSAACSADSSPGVSHCDTAPASLCQ